MLCPTECGRYKADNMERRLKFTAAAAGIALLCCLAPDAEAQVTLEQCMRQARQNYPQIVQFGLIDEAELSYGGMAGAYLDLPVFFRRAVRAGAYGVVLVHNHPDGSRFASRDDERLTEHVRRALGVLGIKLKRHYIAAGGELFPVDGAEEAEPPRRN